MIRFEFKQRKLPDERMIWGVGLLPHNGLRGVYYGLLILAECDINPDTQSELALILGLSSPTFSKYRNRLQEYNLIKMRIEKADTVYELYIPEDNYGKRN